MIKRLTLGLVASAALLGSSNGFSQLSVRSSCHATARVQPLVRPALFMSTESSAISSSSSSSSTQPKDSGGGGGGGDMSNGNDVLVTGGQKIDLNAAVNNGVVLAIAMAILLKVSLVDSGMTRGWTAAEMALRIPMDNWADYYAVLMDSPIQTKAVTSATVYTIGDIIAQRTEGTSMGDLDRGRILRSLLAGLIAHGPLSHYWYDVSEGFFNDYLHWTEWWSFFPKVILDQATWGPFWNNTYILLLGLMKRESWGSIWGDIKRTTIPLVVAGLKLWPLAHCVTYGLIPVENRLLWVDVVEIIWVTILATQASGSDDVAAEAQTEEVPANAESTEQY